ncbi:hypothetical protein CP49_17895 [Bradyrhizobium valentinum]|uniref:Uncharacterized protein n=1 Tax=Bradyrhizobium valentinum TaxID=1518501 RepID=A0A0R3KW87_9BRAD|nr:hypothetical protein CP49_17895 [Bradyrhizobium valentinum]
MHFAKRTYANVQRSFQERFSVLWSSDAVQDNSEIVEAACHQRVELTERFLAYGQRAASQPFGFAVMLIVAEQHHKIVERDGDIKVVRT